MSSLNLFAGSPSRAGVGRGCRARSPRLQQPALVMEAGVSQAPGPRSGTQVTAAARQDLVPSSPAPTSPNIKASQPHAFASDTRAGAEPSSAIPSQGCLAPKLFGLFGELQKSEGKCFCSGASPLIRARSTGLRLPQAGHLPPDTARAEGWPLTRPPCHHRPARPSTSPASPTPAPLAALPWASSSQGAGRRVPCPAVPTCSPPRSPQPPAPPRHQRVTGRLFHGAHWLIGGHTSPPMTAEGMENPKKQGDPPCPANPACCPLHRSGPPALPSLRAPPSSAGHLPLLAINTERLGMEGGREENRLVFNEKDQTTRLERAEENRDPREPPPSSARLRSSCAERMGRTGRVQVWDHTDPLPRAPLPSALAQEGFLCAPRQPPRSLPAPRPCSPRQSPPPRWTVLAPVSVSPLTASPACSPSRARIHPRLWASRVTRRGCIPHPGHRSRGASQSSSPTPSRQRLFPPTPSSKFSFPRPWPLDPNPKHPHRRRGAAPRTKRAAAARASRQGVHAALLGSPRDSNVLLQGRKAQLRARRL